LLFYARAIHFAATILVAGVALFYVFAAEPALRRALHLAHVATTVRRRFARLAWSGLFLAVVSGAAWLVIAAIQMSGRSAGDVVADGTLWTVLSQTQFGKAWLLRLAVAVLLGGAFLFVLSPRAANAVALRAATTILAALFVGGLAWSGHGAGGLGIEAIVHPTADVLHLLAAAAWVGALPPLAVLLHAARQKPETFAVAGIAAQRFSLLGIAAVATLLVTGIVNSWYLVGSPAALIGTVYGRLLTAKIALFLGMIALAAVNRLVLTPRIVQQAPVCGAQSIKKLGRNAVIETAAGAVIIGIVAMLGTMPPAIHAAHHHPAYTSVVPADAAFVHIHSDQGMAEVTIEPGRAGRVDIITRLWTSEFAPLAAQRVTVTLTLPAGGQSIMRVAAPDAEDAWRVDDVTLPQPGDWTVKVEALLGPDRQLTLLAPIVIEPER